MQLFLTALLLTLFTSVSLAQPADVEQEVTQYEFTVTEVYQEREEGWKMLGMSFSSVRDTHEIEH